MMKSVHTIASILIVALGLLHCGFTFINYHGISFDAAWFIGTGFAIILAGFMNIAMLRDGGKDTVIWTMALITNVVFLLGFGAGHIHDAPAAGSYRSSFVFGDYGLFVYGETYDNCHCNMSDANISGRQALRNE